MLILSILLSLLTPQQFSKDKVTIDFKFKSIKLGVPTLAYYNYDVSITNNTNKATYVIIPRWFDKEMLLTDKVWGAQYDNFGGIKGATFFCTNSVTVFWLEPKEKITLTNYDIETFDVEIENRLSTGVILITCSDITIGKYSFEDFMDNKEVQDDNLEYKLKDASLQSTSVKTKK